MPYHDVASVILIVEDNYLIASSISAELEQAGYITAMAQTHGGVSRMVERICPDLALVDLYLESSPDGDEIAAMLVQNGVPVVLLTGVSLPVAEEVGARVGATAILEKPVEYELLLRTVAALLKA